MKDTEINRFIRKDHKGYRRHEKPAAKTQKAPFSVASGISADDSGNQDKKSGEQIPDGIHKRAEEEGKIPMESNDKVENTVINHHTQDGKAAKFIQEEYPFCRMWFHTDHPF